MCGEREECAHSTCDSQVTDSLCPPCGSQRLSLNLQGCWCLHQQSHITSPSISFLSAFEYAGLYGPNNSVSYHSKYILWSPFQLYICFKSEHPSIPFY